MKNIKEQYENTKQKNNRKVQNKRRKLQWEYQNNKKITKQTKENKKTNDVQKWYI